MDKLLIALGILAVAMIAVFACHNYEESDAYLPVASSAVTMSVTTEEGGSHVSVDDHGGPVRRWLQKLSRRHHR